MSKNNSGYALMEMIVVIGAFTILAVLVTQVLVLTIRGSKKSDAQNKVRANVDYAIEVMERNLRNSRRLKNCQALEDGTEYNVIQFVNEDGVDSFYRCTIASGSDNGSFSSFEGDLTSDQIKIVSCSITCSVGGEGKPDLVSINLEAESVNETGVEADRVSTQTQIQMRNF